MTCVGGAVVVSVGGGRGAAIHVTPDHPLSALTLRHKDVCHVRGASAISRCHPGTLPHSHSLDKDRLSLLPLQQPGTMLTGRTMEGGENRVKMCGEEEPRGRNSTQTNVRAQKKSNGITRAGCDVSVDVSDPAIVSTPHCFQIAIHSMAPKMCRRFNHSGLFSTTSSTQKLLRSQSQRRTHCTPEPEHQGHTTHNGYTTHCTTAA